MNDVLAFTVSPWYNKHERARLIAEEKASAAAEKSTEANVYGLNHQA